MIPLRLVAPLLLLPWSGCLIGDDQGDAGSDEAPAMDGTGAGTGTTACFEPPYCDPLSSACASAELCVPNGNAFECMPLPEDSLPAGLGEGCTGALSCEEGLLCVNVTVTGCSGGTGCCLALCDLMQAQCPMGAVCMAYYGEAGGESCYEDVGVCLPG